MKKLPLLTASIAVLASVALAAPASADAGPTLTGGVTTVHVQNASGAPVANTVVNIAMPDRYSAQTSVANDLDAQAAILRESPRASDDVRADALAAQAERNRAAGVSTAVTHRTSDNAAVYAAVTDARGNVTVPNTGTLQGWTRVNVSGSTATVTHSTTSQLVNGDITFNNRVSADRAVIASAPLSFTLSDAYTGTIDRSIVFVR